MPTPADVITPVDVLTASRPGGIIRLGSTLVFESDDDLDAFVASLGIESGAVPDPLYLQGGAISLGDATGDAYIDAGGNALLLSLAIGSAISIGTPYGVNAYIDADGSAAFAGGAITLGNQSGSAAWINLDGTAYLASLATPVLSAAAGNITIGSSSGDNASIAADGTASFAGSLTAPYLSTGSGAIMIGNVGATGTNLPNDGSASFAAGLATIGSSGDALFAALTAYSLAIGSSFTIDHGGLVTGIFSGDGSALTNLPWSALTGTPTTRSGYGITDALAPDGDGSALTNLPWSALTGTPTTRAGYGITDALAPDGDGSALTGLELYLGLPASDGYLLSSTAAGVRSWVPPAGGSDPLYLQSGALSFGDATGAAASIDPDGVASFASGAITIGNATGAWASIGATGTARFAGVTAGMFTTASGAITIGNTSGTNGYINDSGDAFFSSLSIAGTVSLPGLPTSASGLPVGALWFDPIDGILRVA